MIVQATTNLIPKPLPLNNHISSRIKVPTIVEAKEVATIIIDNPIVNYVSNLVTKLESVRKV